MCTNYRNSINNFHQSKDLSIKNNYLNNIIKKIKQNGFKCLFSHIDGVTPFIIHLYDMCKKVCTFVHKNISINKNIGIS